jgi:hypothetical protein
MAVQRFELVVHGDDGSQVEVTADQRDIAAFERAEKVGFTRALDDMPMVFFRALGYFALRRTGKLDLKVTRTDWDEGIVEVELADEEPVDPTNQEAPAGT